jgi:hypothetical protein
MTTFQGLLKPGGVSWWAALNYAFQLSLSPSIGIIEGGASSAAFGLSLLPSIQMVPTSISVSSFNLSLPGLTIGIATPAPTTASFNLALSPALSMIGKEQYARSFSLGLTPTIGMVGGSRTPAVFGLSMSLSINMVALSGLVTRDSATGNLIHNGQRFRFAGGNAVNDTGMPSSANGNAYGGTVVSGSYLATHSQIDAYLSSAVSMNATAIRSWGVMSVNHSLAVHSSMGVYNASALENVDYLLQQCGIRGIKVILPLVGNSDRSWYCSANGVTPDADATQFYTNTTIINSFKGLISFVLNHVNQYTGLKYKDDPAIVAWQFGNELTDSGLADASFSAWHDTISQHIKVTESAQQLVMWGCTGISSDNVTFDSVRMSLPYVDVFANHCYDNFRIPSWVSKEAQAAHLYGKAYVVDEYSWTDKQVNGSALSWILGQMLSMIEGSPFLDGDNFWDLLAPLTSWGDGFTLHYPGDNSDMITRATQLANHASTMQTPAPATPPKSQTLVDVFSLFDSAKWTARSGATVSSGMASLPSAASGGSAFSSNITYDLTDSTVIVEFVVKNPGVGNSGCGMYVQPTQAPYANNLLGFIIDGNTMKYRYDTGTVNETTEAYSATDHRWLRLRADPHTGVGNGTVYWDVSADGVTWVNKRSFTPGLLLNSVYLILYNENWGGDTGSGTALFDNFNNLPVVAPNFYPPVKRPNYGALLQV